MRIVIFGGTFNPIHKGHMSVINSAIAALKPDRFILMPTHIPPHKQADSLAGDKERFEMCRLAVKDIPLVETDDYEQTVKGKSYTVNTLEYLHKLYPSDELYFLMGSDMMMSFLSWYRTDRILELASLVGISRSRSNSEAIKISADRIREAGGRVLLIDCDPIEVSSTDVRSRIMAYSSAQGLVSDAVEEYILKNGLYNFDKTKYNSYIGYLEKHLSEKRFIHSVNVANEALRLAYHNGCDLDRAYTAGLLHDICKELPNDEQLSLALRSSFEVTDIELAAPKTYHGIAAAVLLEESFGITDKEILSAIRYHTVGKGEMTLLEKIVFMADLISAERDFEDVDYVRSVTYKDIDLGMYEAMKFSIGYSCSHVRTIPYLTLDAYNDAVRYKLKVKKD